MANRLKFPSIFCVFGLMVASSACAPLVTGDMETEYSSELDQIADIKHSSVRLMSRQALSGVIECEAKNGAGQLTLALQSASPAEGITWVMSREPIPKIYVRVDAAPPMDATKQFGVEQGPQHSPLFRAYLGNIAEPQAVSKASKVVIRMEGMGDDLVFNPGWRDVQRVFRDCGAGTGWRWPW